MAINITSHCLVPTGFFSRPNFPELSLRYEGSQPGDTHRQLDEHLVSQLTDHIRVGHM